MAAFYAAFPGLTSTMYTLGDPAERDAWLRRVLAGADIVLVHEWNDPDLIRAIGRLGHEFPHLTTLFHDTHYRAYSEPETMRALALEQYGAVLAFSPSIAAIYRGDFGLPRVYVVTKPRMWIYSARWNGLLSRTWSLSATGATRIATRRCGNISSRRAPRYPICALPSTACAMTPKCAR